MRFFAFIIAASGMAVLVCYQDISMGLLLLAVAASFAMADLVRAGSPMIGSFDIHGHPYGVTEQHATVFGPEPLDHSSLPAVNIDGSPMVGDIDIHGHPYGVTDSNDWNSGFDSGYDYSNTSDYGGNFDD